MFATTGWQERQSASAGLRVLLKFHCLVNRALATWPHQLRGVRSVVSKSCDSKPQCPGTFWVGLLSPPSKVVFVPQSSAFPPPDVVHMFSVPSCSRHSGMNAFWTHGSRGIHEVAPGRLYDVARTGLELCSRCTFTAWGLDWHELTLRYRPMQPSPGMAS